MQRSEVSGAVRPKYGSLGFKRLTTAVTAVCLYYTRMIAIFMFTSSSQFIIHFQLDVALYKSGCFGLVFSITINLCGPG